MTKVGPRFKINLPWSLPKFLPKRWRWVSPRELAIDPHQLGQQLWHVGRRSLVILAILGVGATPVALRWYWLQLQAELPDSSEVLTFVRDGTLTIVAEDDTVLHQIGPISREQLSIRQLPPQVVQAFIAAEDRRFYQHDGVDYWSIVRAIITNALAGEVVEGGSTITQQLARIVYLDQEKSLNRKFREALLAQKLEQEIPKAELLERYINLVYLGSGAYGVADAAWIYFSKSVDELTLPEIAMIAGMPPAPSVYSPLVDPIAARQQRDRVLARMQEAKFITAAEAEAAMAAPLQLNPAPPKNFNSQAPYFTSYVQKEMARYLTPEQIEAGGLTIETTLNAQWQEQAEKVIADTIALDGPAEGFTQAALVAIDPRTGEIKSLVGGSDFSKSQFNRATQAQRQPGSTFKTFVYTTAIATGKSPNQGYEDASFRIDGYEPQNYGRTFRGWVSMREALAASINVVAVKVLVDVGFEPVINVAKAMGIESPLAATYSLALGASEVNLLELTSAYGTLANQGKRIPAHGIRRITNWRGEVLFDASTAFKPKQAVDADTAAIVTWMLESVVQGGTGRAAALGRPVAGKTGTSEKARDLWFVGYIPQLVTGVWLGNDDNTPTYGSSSTAAYNWRLFMEPIVKDLPVEAFPNLPPLEGRQGTIKAQPVRGRATAGTSSSSGKDPSTDNYQYWEEQGAYRDDTYYDDTHYYEEPSQQETLPSDQPAQDGGWEGSSQQAPAQPEPDYVAPASPVEPPPAPVAPEPPPEPAPPTSSPNSYEVPTNVEPVPEPTASP
ncbi:PBP1A family penicillin-binding protein [Trichothermofontia sichuanensis B231]|uniref:transglycosylase domain-containing protein n=1 Tax=Trichothermofontia sichuanensis TaxID=3045816 RepID=UPI0022481C56|nr:PBP1A family penicillin-binding protein [Trichothermofontia sichuanensis]UZQ53456.1 PBP1A family penicillin-binding protein [Trichothermofontia sichuanensis B231]